ncbi:MAG: 16S rRNA (uracil(1498)-N(3))-methyltransferase [Nitrospirota bacterium]|nr:MAG: 16S rRNA (uracil(1498)-N(3))-methyltransferase [Nitrospirota bacterium]
MPIFFISSTDIQGSVVSLSPPLSLHLSKSLRVQPGQTIVLGDEQRRRHRATVRQIEKGELVAEIQDTQCGPGPEVPPIILGQSILKGEKMTSVVQKGTELGVTCIVPLLSERVIPRLSSAPAKRHQERWQRIALEAAQQSERWEVPTVGAVQSFGEFCGAMCPKEYSLILVERDPQTSLHSIPLPTQWEGCLTLLVGPEGGWTGPELTEAEKKGCQKVSLGARILRAETATIAALTILQARLGHLG